MKAKNSLPYWSGKNDVMPIQCGNLIGGIGDHHGSRSKSILHIDDRTNFKIKTTLTISQFEPTAKTKRTAANSTCIYIDMQKLSAKLRENTSKRLSNNSYPIHVLHAQGASVLAVSKLQSFNLGFVQGSGLGPTLFLVLASDINTLSSNNEFIKFADDSTFLVPGNSDVNATSP